MEGQTEKTVFSTLPETKQIAPENRPKPNRKVVFHPSLFRGDLLVSGSVVAKPAGVWNLVPLERGVLFTTKKRLGISMDFPILMGNLKAILGMALLKMCPHLLSHWYFSTCHLVELYTNMPDA